jgi:hypothetical protein
MKKGSMIKTAMGALDRAHSLYGEEVRLLKFIPSATGSIYRQSKRIYEPPLTILCSVSRFPNERETGPTGESSERNAEITLTISYMKALFGDSTDINHMITVSDLIILDNRVWRITQASMTGRVGDKPLLMHLILREKLGVKEVDYE